MKVFTIDGQDYRLPNAPNPFQLQMYIHLIDWKWQHITTEPGYNRGLPYDAILPDACAEQRPMLYPAVNAALQEHLQRFPFRIHKFFNHMASSQAANLNLFLPILRSANTDEIFSRLRPDFARLATQQLDHGYRIEFWDEPYGKLHDKTPVSGTDADIAIAYYNHQNELCLWLIEHKLTEAEFTTCGGYRSPGRKPPHDCSRSFAAILADKHLCYYHDVSGFTYWDITEANQVFFVNHAQHAHCPFQGGLNQLWRNQLLALSVEQDDRQPYQRVSFSVVRHIGNTYLDPSLRTYQDLIGHNPKFSTFTSTDVLNAASASAVVELNHWITWYRALYNL